MLHEARDDEVVYLRDITQTEAASNLSYKLPELGLAASLAPGPFSKVSTMTTTSPVQTTKHTD